MLFSVVMGKGPSIDLHTSRGGDISGGEKLLGRQERVEGPSALLSL